MFCGVDFTMKASPLPPPPPVSAIEMSKAQLINMRWRGKTDPKAMMSSPFV